MDWSPSYFNFALSIRGYPCLINRINESAGP
jgi:hypothetical protein